MKGVVRWRRVLKICVSALVPAEPKAFFSLLIVHEDI